MVLCNLLPRVIWELYIAKYCFNEFRLLNKEAYNMSNHQHPLLNKDKRNRLFQQCKLNRMGYKNAIEMGYWNINDKYDNIGTLLDAFCRVDDVYMVNYLIDKSCLDNENINSLIHLACLNDCINVLKYLSKDTNLNILDNDGMCPLHSASISNANSCLEYLISKKVVLDLKDNEGKTSLILAMEHENINIIELLFNNNADPLISDYEGNTMFHIACKRETGISLFSEEKYSSVINTVIDIPNNRNQTLLIIAARGGQQKLVNILLEKGANYSIFDNDGMSAIFYCCENEDFKSVSLLLEKDKNLLNIENEDGLTPLNYSIECGSYEMVKFLLDKNDNVNRINSQGYTSLHFASMNHDIDIFELLIRNNALVVTDKSGKYPFYYTYKFDEKKFQHLIKRQKLN